MFVCFRGLGFLFTPALIAMAVYTNFQVLGVGLAVSLCITVIFIWGLLNINKIQVTPILDEICFAGINIWNLKSSFCRSMQETTESLGWNFY